MIPSGLKGKRGRGILIIAGLVLVVGAYVALVVSARGPLYKGKRAAQWLDELITTEGNSIEAKRAFQEMGSRAAPYLVNELTRKSELRDKYVAIQSKLPHALFVATPSWRTHRNWRRRQYAATALGEIGPPATAAIPALIETVSKTEPFETDPSTGASGGPTFSPKARIAAIQALWKISPESPSVVSTVVAALQQKYFCEVESHAIMVLADLGPEFKSAIPTVIQNLKFYDKRQPRLSVPSFYPVGGLAPGYAESVPRLTEALKDTNPRTREAVAYDLGTLNTPDLPVARAAIPGLIAALQDQDVIVRITAAEAIRNIDWTQCQTTVPALIDLLGETNYTVRLRAVDLLRQMATEATPALPALEKALQDNARIVQVWAAEALTQIQSTISNEAHSK